MEYFLFVLVRYFYDFFSWIYGWKLLKMYDQPQREYKMEHKTVYFGGTDSSYLLKSYQELKNTKSLPNLIN